MRTPTITPMPPVATGAGLPWDEHLEDPVDALAEARRSLGDTFVVDSGDDRYLFTFAPTGVKSFYALPEDRASKGVADWRMLRRKLPDEMFDGRRTLPHQLFGRDDVAAYLGQCRTGSRRHRPRAGCGRRGRGIRADQAVGAPGRAGIVGRPRFGRR